MNKDIIREANEHKIKDHGSIYNVVHIMGKDYPFTKQYFFDDKVSVYFPKDFEDLPDVIKKIKYPSESRPQIIKSDMDEGVDFTLNLVEAQVSDAEIEIVADQMFRVLKNFKPAETYLEKKVEISSLTGKKLCWYDYISHGIDASVYQFQCATSVENKLMCVGFSCPASSYIHWKEIIIEVINSLTSVDF